jgi:CspA family cold shock protein
VGDYSELCGTGFRSVAPGDAVEFEWEAAEQDGFAYRAYRVETLPRGAAGQ